MAGAPQHCNVHFEKSSFAEVHGPAVARALSPGCWAREVPEVLVTTLARRRTKHALSQSTRSLTRRKAWPRPLPNSHALPVQARRTHQYRCESDWKFRLLVKDSLVASEKKVLSRTSVDASSQSVALPPRPERRFCSVGLAAAGCWSVDKVFHNPYCGVIFRCHCTWPSSNTEAAAQSAI